MPCSGSFRIFERMMIQRAKTRIFCFSMSPVRKKRSSPNPDSITKIRPMKQTKTEIVFPARVATVAKTITLPTEAFSHSSICYYKLINRSSAAGLSDHQSKSLFSFEVDVPLSEKPKRPIS